MMFGLALVLALVLGVSTTALAAIPGDPFRLGQTNGIDAMSTLVGNVAGTMLRVDNNSTGAGATALDLRVEPGKAPMKVNSATRVALLNADKVDGKDSTDFYAAGSKVADSLHADQADSATSAGDANTLDGKDSTAFLGTTQKAADSDKLDGKNSSDFAAAYKRTVVVSPTGTDTENGTALLAALNGITDASASKPYLIYIEPGTYDLGSDPLQMKQHVDIEGAGELKTVITSDVSHAQCGNGTVNGPLSNSLGTTNTELRFLTVRNTGVGDCNIAIRIEDTFPPRLTHVTAEAKGSGTSRYFGVYILDSSPIMTDVTATASGNNGVNVGVYNVSANPTMSNVTAMASGGKSGVGVSITLSSNPTIRQSKLSGTTNSLWQESHSSGAVSTTKIAITQLVGPVRKDSGTLQCFNNYDQNLAAVTCP